ncbi:MAG: hypothetical protein K5695_11440 [Oscillospiraceae bacterium]|nr:hypothetical protein [Oscillospiraceae bacterium]
MGLSICGMKQYDVTVGEIVLHLAEYRLTGSCAVREQGTAQGHTAVTACWSKGTKLVLKGKLSEAADVASVAAALDGKLRAGETMGLRLGHLLYRNALLIGYSLGEGYDVPEVVLIFLTNTVLETEDET